MKKIIVFCLNFWLFSAVVSANVPAPFFGGYAGFEPNGLQEFEAVSEKIFIDMSNLEIYSDYRQEKAVKLENIFELENKKDEKYIEISLPFGKDYHLYLDEIDLSVNIAAKNDETVKWKTPTETVWFEGKKLSYRAINNQSQSVQIKIPTGKHTLKIVQNLAPSNNVTGILTKYWQFSFVFLPEANRKNIGKTEVEIKTPQNWETVVSPELKNENGVWKGVLENKSLAAITITTKMPVPERYFQTKNATEYFFYFSLFVFPLIGLFLCILFFYKSKIWWVWGILFTLFWTFLTALSIGLSEFLPESVIPEVQQLNYGYGEIGSLIAVVFIAGVVLISGFPLWLLTWFLTRKIRKTS